jgi:hypothetical protein
MDTPNENSPPRNNRALEALQDLGMELAERWASGFEKRPTQQLILQKIVEPVVRHILNTIFPWAVGMAILFLVLLLCTVITCVIVLRSGSGGPGGAVATTACACAAMLQKSNVCC